MILAGMVTHTSIVDLMQMEIRLFYRVLVAVCDVLDKRKNNH